MTVRPISEPSGESAWLEASGERLALRYDVGLLDLDGTVYVGADAIPGAVQAVADAGALGFRVGYVTNNASRPPAMVVEQLRGLGLAATRDDVLTSAQAAAALLAEDLPAGSAVLVVGGAGLVEAVLACGLRPVASADDQPMAVAQGWAPELGWGLLAEGAYALSRGLPWIATNTDQTLPTARGIAPGNGSFVSLLAGVVGRRPDAVAGKPHAALLTQAAGKFSALNPIVIGDRLDTDIEGGWASGLPTMLVLTGVTGVDELLSAPLRQRPTYVAADLSGLLVAHPAPTAALDGGWACGPWRACVNADGRLVIQERSGELLSSQPFDGLRAACAAAWSANDDGRPPHWGADLLAELAVG